MSKYASTAHLSDSEASQSSLTVSDDPGWEDAEEDEENISVVSLFTRDVFPTVSSMLENCKEQYGFDLIKVRNELGLDFYDLVKLVNFVRSEVQGGNKLTAITSKAAFEDDRYLRPFLENDTLLYSLGDLDENPGLPQCSQKRKGIVPLTEETSAAIKVLELEKDLLRLQNQFTEYRKTVSRTLDDRWNDKESISPIKQISSNQSQSVVRSQDDDAHYFSSYSYNDIHETMLKDTVRTDAYRDFIYDNKHLFKDKTILDVGCGTGILSMFCARAGAKKVVAVDNSDIIDKARENIFENGLGEIISCLRGKIEDVSLPVVRFDIIVSEWMGYCLLYEAMLDSVLWARDRYLAPDGLMIPSHATLYMAPLSDPDYITDHVSFWQSVYGFNMSSMLAHIYDEVLIRDLEPSTLAADSVPFFQLPLHHITKEDLTSMRRPFVMKLKENIDALDGFVIWFDMFFLPSKYDEVAESAKANDWKSQGGHGIAFTTGPGGPETHWRQGVLLIDHGKEKAQSLRKGQLLCGEIGYKKREDNQRELDIDISWKVVGSEEKGKQLWYMR